MIKRIQHIYVIFFVFCFSTVVAQNLDVIGDGYFSGKLGIGTSTPSSKLQVGNFSSPTGDIYLTVASPGGNTSASGIKLRHVNDDFGFTIESDDKVGAQGFKIQRHVGSAMGITDLFIDPSGNLGIGTTTPSEKLDVEGAIIVDFSSNATPVVGTIRFNPTTNDFEGFNGLYWISLTGYQYEINELIDQDGNSYPTVVIGTQEWMGKSLRTITYNNGDSIPFIGNDAAGATAWSSANYGAYCIYDTTGTGYSNFDIIEFGHLYNWYAVDDSRNVCPSGWHVPTEADFNTLITFLGGGNAGGPMKESGPFYWDPPNFGATNTSGFTALPASGRDSTGTYANLGVGCFMWTTLEWNANEALYRAVTFGTDGVDYNYENKKAGLSIRCVKD
ncbi:MAG: hypothetical protein HKN09_04875 [Saprospiraceae bacterium]|nr:hypothetical protein [Saprospiraceae bacterium]